MSSTNNVIAAATGIALACTPADTDKMNTDTSVPTEETGTTPTGTTATTGTTGDTGTSEPILEDITINGRTHKIFVPASAPQEGIRLAVVAHGAGGNAAETQDKMIELELHERAEKEGYAVLYFEGKGNGAAKFYNVGNGATQKGTDYHCFGFASRGENERTQLVEAIDYAVDTYNIDRDNVHAYGHSQGSGLYSFVVAEEPVIYDPKTGPRKLFASVLQTGATLDQSANVVDANGYGTKFVYIGSTDDGITPLTGRLDDEPNGLGDACLWLPADDYTQAMANAGHTIETITVTGGNPNPSENHTRDVYNAALIEQQGVSLADIISNMVMGREPTQQASSSVSETPSVEICDTGRFGISNEPAQVCAAL